MPTSLLRFGDFVVDRAGYRVLRGGEQVDLSPKLLDLLLHFLDHAGALVTKDALLESVWPDANVTENALAQAISELRQALSYSGISSCARPAAMAAATESAASMPERMALWLPLMRGTFMKPAAQPISAPPGKARRGIACQPPSVNARAP